MTRMNDRQEADRAALENVMLGLRRNVDDLDLAILRMHQAIQRNRELADLLEPAIQLASRSKRRDWKAINLLSAQWATQWNLKQ
jgi:hypothetical protein